MLQQPSLKSFYLSGVSFIYVLSGWTVDQLALISSGGGRQHILAILLDVSLLYLIKLIQQLPEACFTLRPDMPFVK
jgi:hypothetical protein